MFMIVTAQIVMLIIGLVILLRSRRVIQPVDSWWSFAVRDVLWIVLALDNLFTVYHQSLLNDTISIVIQTAIVAFFLYNLWIRYKIQRDWADWKSNLQARIDHLETLRDKEGW